MVDLVITQNNNISLILDNAVECAKRGDVAGSDEFASLAREYADNDMGIALTGEQKKVISDTFKAAREVGIGVALAKAAECAKRGDYARCDGFVMDAREYAKQACIDLSDEHGQEIDNTIKTSREVGISVALAEAAEYAKRGNVVASDHLVRSAERRAWEAAILLTEAQNMEISYTYKLSRVNGIGVALAEATECAKRGDVSGSDGFVRTAREYAEQAGIALTKEQEDEIARIKDLWV